jgi:hypothetical protein
MEDAIPISSDLVNPWSVETLEEFHFYCCPECNDRYQSAIKFKAHATFNHPKVSPFFNKLI